MRSAWVYVAVALLGFVAFVASVEGKTRFDGHSLTRIFIENEQQRYAVERLNFDVWSHESNVVYGENHILLPPGGEKAISDLNLDIAILGTMLEDVQAIIDEQEKARGEAIATSQASWFAEYHPFEEIVFETRRLAEKHDSLVTYLPSIGTTIQGRDIIAVYLHGGPTSQLSKREEGIPADVPKIVFTGGQHAREWIGPATVMYILNQLITNYGTNDEVTELLDKVAIVIVPVVNPDGYDFAWTNNRLWRKNRRHISGSTYGVDLNRNWDSHWGGAGTSRTPSSDTYCGTGPFSEPETQAVSEFISGLGNVIAAIDWHSYSQLILRPWGWTQTPPRNEKYLATLGAEMKQAIKDVHGKDYTNQPSWALYYTTGSAQDWFAEKVNITVSYTIELRDTGKYGFVLPASEIVPTGQESWAAAKLFISKAIENNNL